MLNCWVVEALVLAHTSTESDRTRRSVLAPDSSSSDLVNRLLKPNQIHIVHSERSLDMLDQSARAPQRNTVTLSSSRLPGVGTTIFTVMSQLAVEKNAINLGQGLPDFDCDPEVVNAVTHAMRVGHNQYLPMAGVPVLR